MPSDSFRARWTRRLVYFLCALMIFGGQPALALQETVRIVPREEHPEWLAPWLEAGTYQDGAASAGAWTTDTVEVLQHRLGTWWNGAWEASWDRIDSPRVLPTASLPLVPVEESIVVGAQGAAASAGERETERTAARSKSRSQLLPIRQVRREAASQKAATARQPDAVSATTTPSAPRQTIDKSTIAPEITALAESFGKSPGKIFRFLHDQIDVDPKWGVTRSPVGTLQERRGTAWDQSWLLQQLLTAAGVDARFEWGEVEISVETLTNVTGTEDPWRAADLLTTAGTPITLLVDGSQVVKARITHPWVKAYLDYIPNRGLTPGPGDTWIRMDPSLKRFATGDGIRVDEAVPFSLQEYLGSGTELSPRQVYDDALQAYAESAGLGVTSLDDLKPSKTLIQENFPYVPGTLRGKIVSVAGESPTLPEAFQQHLVLTVQEADGTELVQWETPFSAVYGQRLELAWPGATTADQDTLDLYGGVFATPPYEVDLKPSIRLDGVEVVAGTAIGSAEDVELVATWTTPGGLATTVPFAMWAGEHAVLSLDFGRTPQETVDRYAEARAAATDDAAEQEAWSLAYAAARYHRTLGADLHHLAALRWHRAVNLGRMVLAVQRGAVSAAPDGSPLTFSRGPTTLDLGAMPVGLFPAEGGIVPTVQTMELIGSQGSYREAEALSEAFLGQHETAVTFLTRAVREGQALTRVDETNVESAFDAVDLSAEAEATVRTAIGQGFIAWIPEAQLTVDTFDATGYVVEDPSTGAGGYFVTYERYVESLLADLQFHAPSDLDVVTAPTDVVATIEGDDIASWTLKSQPSGGGPTEVHAVGEGPVTSETIGEFDPTLLVNGLYDLVLTATGSAGNTKSAKITVSVEGNMKIGHFTLSFVDLAIPLSGLDIEILRTYDSREKDIVGDFGHGWTLDIRQGSYQNNRPPGDGWQIINPGGPFGLPCSQTIETKSHLTTVTLSDQEVYRFRLSLTDQATVIGGCQARAIFEWVDGPLPGTTLEILGNDLVIYENESERLIDQDSLEVFVPQNVKLTTRDGRIFHVNLETDVTHLEDLNGNAVDITVEGITHSSGVGIDFVRDAEGRIVEIVDPRGNANLYSYGPQGDLAKHTDRSGAETQFDYRDHYLEDIHNALGVRAVRTEYDDDGRMVKVIDALGHEMKFDHQLESNREVVTDRLGFARVLEYDGRGNVVVEVDELGNTTTRTFDGKDRILSETDPLEHKTMWSYSDAGDLLEFRDAVGNSTRFSYDDRSNPLLLVDSLGREVQFQYDSRGNLTSIRDPLGATVLLEYDSKGELSRETDALGHQTVHSYDSRGNRIRSTYPTGGEVIFEYDENGKTTGQTVRLDLPDGSTKELVTQFEVDALGRTTATSLPDGSTTTTEYNPLGFVSAVANGLRQTTRFEYDAEGHRTKILHPDGSVSKRSFDAEGNLVAVTDELESTTRFGLDPVGRRIQTVYADGSTTSSTYDKVGRLVAFTDERGFETKYTYDAVGRRTTVVDPLGESTSFTYDSVGNQIGLTDALGHEITFRYDDSDRLTATLFPDGTSLRNEYDLRGNRVAQIDQAGVRTEYAFDELGRLSTVRDPMGGTTEYRYDLFGNLTSQTDAQGHTTEFAYDALGRLTSRDLPGERGMERFAYDLAGNRIKHTHFSGEETKLEYDDRGRLQRRLHPDGSLVEFSYLANGRRKTTTDSRGTTTYSYDQRNRVVSVVPPEPWQVDLTWDATGNKTSVSIESGGQELSLTTYEYDPLGRITKVTDSRGGQYRYGYDANGRVVFLEYPNGVTTSYSHDDLGRVLEIRSQKSSGELIEDFSYTVGAAGTSLSVAELDGTKRLWEYDALYRLKKERVVEPDGSLAYETDYAYDSVGNRTREATTYSSEAGETLTYSYDVRNRLEEAVDSAGSTTTFQWSDGGNLLSSTGPSGTTQNRWDSQNRLISQSRPDGTELVNVYDVDGTRISATSTDSSSGEDSVRQFVADTSGNLSQVIAELDGSGSLLREYARGRSLLGVIDSAGPSYTHLDSIGSTRVVTDPAGDVTRSFSYEAFGVPTSDRTDAAFTFLFAGAEWDPVAELYYLRARWMDPRLGRFLSLDPELGVPANPQSLHGYSYAENSPLNKADPTGRTTFSVSGMVAALGIATSVGLSGTFSALQQTPIQNNANFQTVSEIYFKLEHLALLAGLGTASIQTTLLLRGLFTSLLSRITRVVRSIPSFTGRILRRDLGRSADEFAEEIARARSRCGVEDCAWLSAQLVKELPDAKRVALVPLDGSRPLRTRPGVASNPWSFHEAVLLPDGRVVDPLLNKVWSNIDEFKRGIIDGTEEVAVWINGVIESGS